jgi:hypothetical protein
MDWRKSTNEDALAAWDKNEPIWSCDMGGMGPGYEQAIQLMGFEMLRAIVANPPPVAFEALRLNKEEFKAYSDKIEKLPAVKEVISKVQPSGAQFGAAMNIAFVFAINGYAKGMEMVPEDRRIQVQKEMPTLVS